MSMLIFLLFGLTLGKPMKDHFIDPCPHLDVKGSGRKLVKMGENGQQHHCCGCSAGYRLVLSCVTRQFNTTECEPCGKGMYIDEESHNKRKCEIDTRPTTTEKFTSPDTTTYSKTTYTATSAMTTSYNVIPLRLRQQPVRPRVVQLFTSVSPKTSSSESRGIPFEYLFILGLALICFTVITVSALLICKRKTKLKTKRAPTLVLEDTTEQKTTLTGPLTADNDENQESEFGSTERSEFRGKTMVEDQGNALVPLLRSSNNPYHLRVDIEKAQKGFVVNEEQVGTAKFLRPGEVEHSTEPVSPVSEQDEPESHETEAKIEITDTEPSCSSHYYEDSRDIHHYDNHVYSTQMDVVKHFFSTLTILHPDVVFSGDMVTQFGRNFGLGELDLKDLRKNDSSTSEFLFQTFVQIQNRKGKALKPIDIVSYFKTNQQVLLAQKLEAKLSETQKIKPNT